MMYITQDLVMATTRRTVLWSLGSTGLIVLSGCLLLDERIPSLQIQVSNWREDQIEGGLRFWSGNRAIEENLLFAKSFAVPAKDRRPPYIKEIETLEQPRFERFTIEVGINDEQASGTFDLCHSEFDIMVSDTIKLRPQCFGE